MDEKEAKKYAWDHFAFMPGESRVDILERAHIAGQQCVETRLMANATTTKIIQDADGGLDVVVRLSEQSAKKVVPGDIVKVIIIKPK